MRPNPGNKENRDHKSAALIVIDMVTDFEFEDGDELLRRTLPVAEKLKELKERAHAASVPVIYVNDNFGKWQEDFKTMAARFAEPAEKGSEVVAKIMPGVEDYYVLKPHRSAFYSTTLEVLLRHLEIKKLVITGVTTDICILFSANDAYMRGFDVVVPSDCVAAVKQSYSNEALDLIQRVIKADISPSADITFQNK